MGERHLAGQRHERRDAKVLAARRVCGHPPSGQNNLLHGICLQSKAENKRSGKDTWQRGLHSCSTVADGTAFFTFPKPAAARCRQFMSCEVRAGTPRLAGISPQISVVAAKDQQKERGLACFPRIRPVLGTPLITRTWRRRARRSPASSLPEFTAREHPPPAILTPFGCRYDLTEGYPTPFAKANHQPSHRLPAY